jgi:gliding motility-associated-like protein
LELICNAANFTGNANYGFQTANANTPTISKPNTANMAYPGYSIDISTLCPGVTYKYRVRDKHLNYSYWSEWSAVYTFTVPGPPYTINIAANPVVVCPPDCTTLTATSSNNCGPVTYTWNLGLGTGAVKNVCPTVPTTYAVTGSVQVALCPIPITQTASIFIQVDTPAVNGVVVADPPILCQGESTTLTVSGHYGFLQWQSSSSFNGPFNDIPGATSTTYTFNTDLTTEDTYFRVHIYTCTDEYTLPVLVQVFDTPQANFNTNNICADASYVFQNTTVNNSPITTWLWDFGNGASSNQMNPNFFFAPGTYSVSLFAANAAGCSDQITQEIIVYPIPVPSFSIANVCLGNSSSFINNSTVAGPSVINGYAWDIDGDGVINYTSQSPNHNYQFEGNYPVNLTVTTDHGCTASTSLITSVFPNPVANFTTSPVCLSVLSTFFDASTVSNQFTNNSVIDWQWNFGDGDTGAGPNPTHTYDTPSNYTVSLNITTNNGCTHSTSQTISVYPIPVTSFTGTDIEGCSPIFPIITSNSTVAAPSVITNYHWQMSNGLQQNSAVPTFINSFTNNGSSTITYGVQLTVTTNHGCTHTLNEPNFIKVFHNPIASFYYEPFYPNILNTNVDFFNTSLYADSYLWNFGYAGTTTEVNPSFLFPDDRPDIYRVVLIATTEEGCADTAYANVEVQDVLLFYVPNTFTPDDDDFNQYFTPIFTSGFEPLTYHLTIFNRWGEVIFESYDYEIGWDGTYGVGSDKIVPDGTYIWQISFRETMSDKRHLYRGHINILR